MEKEAAPDVILAVDPGSNSAGIAIYLPRQKVLKCHQLCVDESIPYKLSRLDKLAIRLESLLRQIPDLGFFTDCYGIGGRSMCIPRAHVLLESTSISKFSTMTLAMSGGLIVGKLLAHDINCVKLILVPPRRWMGSDRKEALKTAKAFVKRVNGSATAAGMQYNPDALAAAGILAWYLNQLENANC